MARAATRRLAARLFAVSLGAGFMAVATAGAATAHVMVHADVVARQATDVAVTFRVSGSRVHGSCPDDSPVVIPDGPLWLFLALLLSFAVEAPMVGLHGQLRRRTPSSRHK